MAVGGARQQQRALSKNPSFFRDLLVLHVVSFNIPSSSFSSIPNVCDPSRVERVGLAGPTPPLLNVFLRFHRPYIGKEGADVNILLE